MRFLNILYTTLAIAALTASAHSEVDAGIGFEQKRAVEAATKPFHARQSSLFGSTGVRMHRRAKGCRASDTVKTAKKDEDKKKKDEKKDDDKKDKKHKKDKKDKKKHHKEHHKESKKEKSSEEKKDATTKQNKSTDDSIAGNLIGKSRGLIGLSFGGKCSKPDASDKYPNGNINFLNCGISKNDPSSAWNPPNVKLSQLRFVSSDEAAKSGAFGACSKYKSAFDSAASETGVPAVLLMAFAMQESSCNPSVTGGNGEMGMMQLTPDKCKGQNCYNAQTNIAIASRYFANQLKAMDGNALLAIGSYNGWQKGLTYARATSEQYGCYAQNNLDYLNQMLNGWAQGKDGHSMTVYNNLAKCG